MDALAALDRLATEAPREDLPSLLGAVVTIEARLRLRLAESTAPAPAAPVVLDAAAAAVVAGTSVRWLLSKTRGLAFRADLSRKQPKFREDGLRAWLAGRR